MVGKGRPALASSQAQSQTCGWLSWMLQRAMRIKLLFTTTFLLFFCLTFFIRASLTTVRLWEIKSSSIPSPPVERGSPQGVNVSAFWDRDAVYEYAAKDTYGETVEKPIISRVLASVITSRGVEIGAKGKKKSGKQHASGKYERRSRVEKWEMELNRARYRPYWSRFIHLLRAWAEARQFDPQVVEDMSMMDASASPELHKTCAVVGSSGILLHRHYGQFIDSHEMVIRINGAKTESFERHVGSKTTLAFINSHTLRSYSKQRGPCHYPYGGKVPTVVYICQAVHLMDVALCRAGHPDTKLLVTDPRLDVMSARIAKWYSVKQFVQGGGSIKEWEGKHGGMLFHYSSGMQAVMLALGLCQQVNIFGFGKVPGVKHHYHSQQKGEHALHDYAAEYSFYDDLENNRSEAVPFLNEASGFLVPPVRVFH